MIVKLAQISSRNFCSNNYSFESKMFEGIKILNCRKKFVIGGKKWKGM